MKNKSVLFFFSVSVIGGAETNFIKIAKELHNKGTKVYLAVVKSNGPLISLLTPYIQEYVILDFTKIYNIPVLLNRYRSFIVKNNIDTVLNFGLKVEVFSRLFSKTFGVNYLVSNIRSTDDWRKPYHVLLDKLTQYNVDLWVSNSFAGKKAFVNREKINPQKCSVIYNYIEDQLPFLHNSKTKDDQLKIGILSNIKQGKGFEDLLELAKLLKADGINFKFIIAGKDLMNGHFQEMILNTKMESHFLFMGYIENKEAFFKEIDLFILPTYFEGLPTSILESMQYGVPIIATNVGGIPEMIEHNYNGFLTEPGNILEYYEGIKLLTSDSYTYNKYIQNAHLVLRSKFIKSKVIEQWMKILN